MKTISRNEAQHLIQSDANVRVVEVLAPDEFHEFHLPHAVNVPIDEVFDQQIQREIPDKSQPVIVYCQNLACQASPKAAKRMDELGYRSVMDYEAGKEDWKQAGLPIEA
jgi:rhodanese-related sulfurtransferase